MPEFRRRDFIAGVGGGALLAPALTAQAAAADATADTAAGRSRRVELRAGTDLAVALSPDGRTIALDVVGVLWTMPARGGTARRLTSDLFDIAQPDWSTDGRRIAFQSYRDGNFNVWTINPDGTDLTQLTHGPYDHREPRFSPDGRRIAFSSDLSGSYGIYTLDVSTADITVWADTAEEEYEPAWSPDGSRIAFAVGKTRIDVVDSAGGRHTAVTAADLADLHGPQWSLDGKHIYYTQVLDGTSQLMRDGTPVVAGEDVFPFRICWVSANEFLYTADGKIRRRSVSGGAARTVPFAATVWTVTPRYRKRQRDFDSTARRPVIGVGSPTLSPDGRHVAFRALNDIWTMRIGDRPQPLTGDHFWKSDPAWSPDGRWLSYSSDRGGKLDIWLRDLHTGEDRQLTHLAAEPAVSGTWSRDGAHLAFLDQIGDVYTVEVATGAVQKVFGPLWEPGKPSWSKDGRTLAIAALKPYSARYREGLSQILLIDRATGAASYVEPLPYRSLGTRGDDGPVWSPDGTRIAVVIGSVLWVLPVGPDGQPTGSPRQVNDEVTDAPSWSGDSREILYLSSGRLRMVTVASGKARTVPLRLTWANATPRGRTIIHAGRLWDGTSPRIRSNVDVIVEGNRIAAVEPHRSGRDGRLVDASGHLVMPGMVDMHNHREMQGYSYGDRQGRLWLSLGFTTTRSPGSPAYHMVEDRESVQSGARLGPRYFATGEAIDGSRIYYNFMRPVVDDHQLELELERAEALSYDLLKAYVRLPIVWQKKVIEWAHQHRIHATSHYLYPAVGFGGDGMEHIGATNRFGYSRTVSALGAGYQDVIDLFAASQAARTPTLFGAATLFREDTSLVNDHRVRTLYPPWELATLDAAVTTAKTTDQTANRENLANQVAQLVHMLRTGGRVITGTDSPIDHTALSTHMNMRAMVKYGLTPYQALVSATRTPGEFLQEPLGVVRPGMLADILVVDGDPLADIEDAANVRQVMVNGVLHTVPELLAPFANASSSAPVSPMLASVPAHPANAAFWWHDPDYIEAGRRSCCIQD